MISATHRQSPLGTRPLQRASLQLKDSSSPAKSPPCYPWKPANLVEVSKYERKKAGKAWQSMIKQAKSKLAIHIRENSPLETKLDSLRSSFVRSFGNLLCNVHGTSSGPLTFPKPVPRPPRKLAPVVPLGPKPWPESMAYCCWGSMGKLSNFDDQLGPSCGIQLSAQTLPVIPSGELFVESFSPQQSRGLRKGHATERVASCKFFHKGMEVTKWTESSENDQR